MKSYNQEDSLFYDFADLCSDQDLEIWILPLFSFGYAPSTDKTLHLPDLWFLHWFQSEKKIDEKAL